jgi:energy-coupling factor transport system permease protein
LKRLLPYLGFFILVFWMMAAFGEGEETIWKWAWFHITDESMNHGLTISLRMLGFVTYGLLFTSTTDLTLFIMSLIHQCKLSPKWAYGLLAGFRFIPLFQSELNQMKTAHKVRGYKQRNSWKAFMRYSLPLFTQGIRKSERMAIAMEARGFTGTRDRTYYQTPKILAKDLVYLLSLLIVVWGIIIFIE